MDHALLQIILTISLLHMRQQPRPFAHQRHPAPERVPRRAHDSSIDIDLRPHAATQEHSDFLGIDFVVSGYTAVDGFHRACVPEDKREPFAGVGIGEPIPREESIRHRQPDPPGKVQWP